MPVPEPSPVARFLRQVMRPPCAAGLTDAQLLERFVTHHDEAAFEVLVWRHGPAVLGLCRRVLGQEQDAEDAFQATFLVLARKGGSVGKRQAVGSWLYRVAYRVALRAKALAGRRAARPLRAEDVPAAAPGPDPVWGDLRPVLDEEVSRLPEKYRAPFVLCYLDGKTNAEAARELGWPKGTVLSRLAWARRRLRDRLTRRGLAPAAGLLGAALAADPSRAVPPALVASTVPAARLVAGGRAPAGVVSGPVAALIQGVCRTMWWTKAFTVTGGVLAAAALALGVGLAWPTPDAGVKAGQPAGGPKANPERPAARAAAAPAKEKTFAFEIRDKPWKAVFEWYADIAGLPFVGSELPPGTFRFVPPPARRRYTLAEITDLLNEALLDRQYLLLRRAASFTVLPADQKIDPTLLPRVHPDDLGKRGRTELVSVMVPLKGLIAADVGPDVKKMTGPFGGVVTLGTANRLLLWDTAGNLRRIVRTVQEVEAERAGSPGGRRKGPVR